MQNLATAFNKAFSRLARKFRESIEPKKYCFQCNRYMKITGVTHYPNYEILEYDLECGHIIWEKEEIEYWKALDNL